MCKFSEATPEVRGEKITATNDTSVIENSVSEAITFFVLILGCLIFLSFSQALRM